MAIFSVSSRLVLDSLGPRPWETDEIDACSYRILYFWPTTNKTWEKSIPLQLTRLMDLFGHPTAQLRDSPCTPFESAQLKLRKPRGLPLALRLVKTELSQARALALRLGVLFTTQTTRRRGAAAEINRRLNGREVKVAPAMTNRCHREKLFQ
jgi:hypothetical protein